VEYFTTRYPRRLCTGVTTYIRDFVIMAFAEVGYTNFEGEQENETATVAACLTFVSDR
jgi:GDP-D-mannose dehydratase